MTKIARQAKVLELPHAMIYFAPEAEEEFAALGLGRGRMAYYAGRAAAMGPVGAGVVAATFFNFNPDSVAASIPRAWSIAAPASILAARLRAADAALRRMLGAEMLTAPVVTDTGKLAERVARACSVAGKPLFAAHADLDWPEEPHLRLWHALTLLREFRGDAHIAALQHAGLTGLQALALHSASGTGFRPSAAKAMREWSDGQWDLAMSDLRERGLVDDTGHTTETGDQLRADIEDDTDAMCTGPWSALDTDEAATVLTHGKQLAHTLSEAGAVPSDLFGRD